MKHKKLLLFSLLLIGCQLFSVTIQIRSFDHDGFTRIVFEGDRSFQFKIHSSGSTLQLEIDSDIRVDNRVTPISDSTLLEKVVFQKQRQTSILSIHGKNRFEVKRHFVLERPYRVVFDLVESDQAGDRKKMPQPDSPEDTPDPDGENRDTEEEYPVKKPEKKKLIETICIDPGHGGSDFGALGKSGLKEKDVTLKVANRLKEMIESKLGLRVIVTREIDSEVSLNSRVSIANNQKADMFISIHVNSSYRKAARGPETFYVSLKATDQESYDLAQKENESFGEIERNAESDDLKMILWNMAQTEFIRESSKLADFIQSELNVLLNTINRGVKQAPFRVLMRAAMPAVLIEVAFISNSYEEQKLKNDSFLDRIAGSIYSGVSKFIYYHNTMNR
jgi:N-acetylmuramoyl-L-alanine amidase